MKVLGVPVAHKEFIKAQLRMKSAEQLRLLERIPAVESVQAGWLLLSFCAATCSNCWLRTVCPELFAEFVADHDRNVWRCLAEILRVGDVERSSIASSSLPLTLGGVGVGGVLRIWDAAYWGSWVDCLEMVECPIVCPHSCRCGRLLDAFGHHRAACSRSGVLGRRGFAVESAVAQICREGCTSVHNVMFRDLDISPPQNSDGQRLEVVAEGLTLFGGCRKAEV